MSSDPIEVLRELVNKWRDEAGPVDQIYRLLPLEQSGAMATHGCVDELDAALASLSAPKPSDQPDPIGDIKAALEGREGWHALSAHVRREGDTLLIAGLSVTAPKPESAEAVPAGYVQIAKPALREMIGDERMAQLEAMCVYPTAPPRPEASAPVGVEWLVAEWRTTAARKRAHGSGVAVAEANGYDMAANGLERALAQQPAADPRSTHHVHRATESLPCCCPAKDDHPTGSEQPAAVDEATRRDAERYRWLRMRIAGREQVEGEFHYWRGEELALEADAAIDQARGKGGAE